MILASNADSDLSSKGQPLPSTGLAGGGLDDSPHEFKQQKINGDHNTQHNERNNEVNQESSDRAAVFAWWPVLVDQKRNRKGDKAGIKEEEGTRPWRYFEAVKQEWKNQPVCERGEQLCVPGVHTKRIRTSTWHPLSRFPTSRALS